MNRAAGALPAMLFAACVPHQLNIDRQAVDDYVATAGLTPVTTVRTQRTDSWQPLNRYYVVYETRRGAFLLVFTRQCWALDTNEFVADERWGSEMRARFDTLRGCRIDEIYSITEAQALELENLSDAPQSTSD